MNSIESIIKSIEEVVSLSPHEKSMLASRLSFRRIKKNQFALHAGEICRNKTFVVRGCLRSYYTDDVGHSHIMNFAIENWWIEDLDSFISQKPSTLAIDAVEDTEVFQLDKPAWMEILREAPNFEKFFRIQSERYAISQQKRVIMNLSLDARKKYKVFQQKCGHLLHRVPQHHIASYLGITPQFLSQIRSEARYEKTVSAYGCLDRPGCYIPNKLQA